MPNIKIPNTTKEQVTNELNALIVQFGGITETLINQHCSFSRRAVRTHFGSISNAEKELNSTTEQNIEARNKPASRKGIPRKTWNKDEVIELINTITLKHGYFSKGLIDIGGLEYGAINHKVISRIWGNFANMYIELNIPQKPDTKGEKIIQDIEYLNIIKNYITNNNIDTFNGVILEQISKEHFFSHKTIYERFGSLEEIALKLNVEYIRKWQSEENAIKFIETYLDNNNYIKQYRHDAIKNIRTLPIDAFWADYNLCLEYNGEQHYKFSKHFHKTESDFENRQLVDALKYNQIQELGFKLLIIKYNDSEKDVIDKLNLLGF